MNDNVIKQLESFDRVWTRVTGEKPNQEKAKPNPASNMRMLLKLCCEARGIYRDCAKMSRTCAEKFSAMAQDEELCARQIQLELFLLDGDATIPISQPCLSTITLSDLRSMYLLEMRISELAAKTGGAAYGEILENVLCKSNEHIKTIRSIIYGLIKI